MFLIAKFVSIGLSVSVIVYQSVYLSLGLSICWSAGLLLKTIFFFRVGITSTGFFKIHYLFYGLRILSKGFLSGHALIGARAHRRTRSSGHALIGARIGACIGAYIGARISARIDKLTDTWTQ